MNVQTKPFRRYSVRRTNPFQGVVQIVSSTDSRALSLDGVNWEIQIRTQPPGDTWGGTPAIQQEKRFLRFGVWSTTEGLKKVPANPILDLTKMLETADELLEVLKTSHNHLPFPLADRFECWLLDGKKRSPLALLSSTVHSDRLQTPINPRWKCADRGKHDFSSRQTAKHRSHPCDNDPRPHMSMLERLVRNRSSPAMTCWFERDESGSGTVLGPHPSDHSVPQRLPPSAFPELLLLESWPEPAHQSLVADYLVWLSPYLLTLQRLSDKTRDRLEAMACRRVLAVDENWHLYPKIVNAGILTTARVEARLRRVNNP